MSTHMYHQHKLDIRMYYIIDYSFHTFQYSFLNKLFFKQKKRIYLAANIYFRDRQSRLSLTLQ